MIFFSVLKRVIKTKIEIYTTQHTLRVIIRNHNVIFQQNCYYMKRFVNTQ